jgi:hypothetical protein
MTLFKWLRQAEVDEGAKPGVSRNDSAELREARKRIKLLEQENEVLRRATAYLSQANLPGKALLARERAGRRRCPGRGDVPGLGPRSTAVLSVACQPVTATGLERAYQSASLILPSPMPSPRCGYCH